MCKEKTISIILGHATPPTACIRETLLFYIKNVLSQTWLALVVIRHFEDLDSLYLEF